MGTVFKLNDQLVASDKAGDVLNLKKRIASDSGELLTFDETEANVRELYAQSLFDKASVVYTAGGIKASKAYSVKGTDFTVTRAGVKNVVNRAGVLTEIPANTPATEFSGGVLKGTLIEPARTNLLLRSEEFDSPYWTKAFLNVTGTPPWVNVAVAPDGTLTADKLIADNTSNLHGISRPFSGFSGAYTYSIFAKAGEYGYISFGQGNPGLRTYFDLVNGVVLGASSGVGLSNPKIKNYGNGWYRCSGTVAASPSSPEFIARPHPTGTGSETFTGDGTSGIFIWGAQLENGSVATSYIKTVDTAITQPADVITATGVSSVLPQTEGWMYAEVDVTNFASNAPFLYAQENANLVNRIELQKRDTSVIRAFSQKQISGTPVASQVSTPVIGLGVYKLLMKLEPIGYKLFVNGSLIASNTTQENPNTLDTVRIGSISTGAGQPGDPIHSIAIGIGPISDAEAITLTTL
jgi:hypothetical protein